MPKYSVKLLKKENIARETMAFHFEKPVNFEFRAGQFGEFTLVNPPETDEEGNSRPFSLSNALYETDLMFATRMRDTAFKRVLKNLPIGTELTLNGPHGNFVLQKNPSPAVFLTGGIGITPVRSIIADASKNQLPHKITLFYSNKTPEDAAFLDDLRFFAKENSNFTFVPVMTKATPDQWQGESGHVTAEMLKKYVPDLIAPIYYLSGPANMVEAMRQLLNEAQVNEDNIRTEKFSGY